MDNGLGEFQSIFTTKSYEDDKEEGPESLEDPSAAQDPTEIRERIEFALESLARLKSRSDTTISRTDIMAKLSRDISEYYGYIKELSDFLLDLFSPAECVEYMDASDRPRPLVIRTNTLKTTRKDLMEALTKRGCAVQPIEWSKVAVKVTDSTVPIGATPEYLAGRYMLQSAASMNPVMALDPQPGERVLDMSAAPGGKTTYISQLMKNSGAVIANDFKPQRQKATIANLHRMGVKNAIVCCYDGRKLPQVLKSFDRVLLDAPCSGLGVISRDQSVKIQRTEKDIQRIAHLQKELLCAAVDCVDPKSKTGGIIVYSTCSVSCDENEQVIDYILRKRYVKLVVFESVGKPGLTRHKEKRFHPSISLTRRFYPHVHNMDGFYVAKLKKFANGPRMSDEDDENEEGGEDEEGGNDERWSEEDEDSGEEDVEDVDRGQAAAQPQAVSIQSLSQTKKRTANDDRKRSYEVDSVGMNKKIHRPLVCKQRIQASVEREEVAVPFDEKEDDNKGTQQVSEREARQERIEEEDTESPMNNDVGVSGYSLAGARAKRLSVEALRLLHKRLRGESE